MVACVWYVCPGCVVRVGIMGYGSVCVYVRVWVRVRVRTSPLALTQKNSERFGVCSLLVRLQLVRLGLFPLLYFPHSYSTHNAIRPSPLVPSVHDSIFFFF